jgi:hypothetical protein
MAAPVDGQQEDATIHVERQQDYLTTRMPVGALGGTATGCDTLSVWPATVAVAVRASVPVLAATANVTVPLPLPVAPDVMLIHDDCSDEDHVQPAGEVTAKVALPPTYATSEDVGDTVYVQGTPAWLTVRVWPAIVIVPVRVALDELAAMVKATVPSPLPLAPPVIVIQLAVFAAVHAQPAGAVTAKVLDPAPAPTERLAGDTLYVQGVEPAWLTLSVWPAIVIVPLRLALDEFVATAKATVPPPVPLVPPVIVIQLTLLAAVHTHPAGAVTAKVLDAAAAPTERLAGETE